MSPGCREFQARWLEHAAPAAAVDDGVSAHFGACAGCAAFARRALRLLRAFAELERLAVPEALPGRVVAACNPGYRQDRAAAWLQTIARVEPPLELERKVLGSDDHRLHAPRVLERLVDEDLRDPSKALTRRFASRLERLEAPDGLLERVQVELARRGSQRSGSKERTQALRWSIAGVLLALSVAFGAWYGARDAEAASTLAFRVERVKDVRELDGLARELAGGLSGGWTDITWEQAR